MSWTIFLSYVSIMAMTTAGSWIPTCLAINFHHFHEGKLEELTFQSFCRAWFFFFGCSGTHEKLIKTGTLRKLGKWAPKLSRPTHPAVSVVFFLLPEPCRAKQAKQGVLGWVEANPVISGGWITQNCWKNMFYYWKYWK